MVGGRDNVRGRKFLIEEKLIELVKARPVLYKKTHPQHLNRLIVSNSWSKIQEEIEDDEFASTGEKCQDLWANIWSQYLAYKKKLEFKTGKGGGKKPNFRHADTMREFEDKEYVEEVLSNVTFDDGGGDESLPDCYTGENGQVIMDILSDGNLTTGLSEPRATNCEKKSLPSSFRSHEGNKKRSLNEFEQEMVGILKSQNSMDEHDLFGATRASKLRKISQSQPDVSSELQFKLHELIYKTEKANGN